MQLREIANPKCLVLEDIHAPASAWSLLSLLAPSEPGAVLPEYLVLKPQEIGEPYRVLSWKAEREPWVARLMATVDGGRPLNDWVASLPWNEAPALDGGLSSAGAPDLVVVLEAGAVCGVLDLRLGNQPGAASLSLPMGRVSRGSPLAPYGKRFLSGRPIEESTLPSEDFNAYPRLDAPLRVRKGETFEVVVGFREQEDSGLSASQPIQIENPDPETKVGVVLFADGLDLEGSRYRSLELDLAASASYRMTARDVQRARISIDYVVDGQVVGSASREIAVRAAPRLGAVDAARQLGSVGQETAVDLTLTIRRGEDEHLEWTIFAPRPKISLGPIRRRFEGTREFAAALLDELKPLEFKGFFAHQVLLNKGQAVADAMPPEVFESLRAVHLEIGRRPTLLLRTEETYVPWELALLDQPLDPEVHPFLGTQTEMGRWLRHDRVPDPPPIAFELERCTVVASSYGRGTGQRSLPEAPKERRSLLELFGRYQLATHGAEAELSEITEIVAEPASPGHLIHFAAHGLSDPEAADHLLLLADQRRLPSSALMGRYRPGDVPRFAFVFLNACQLGTAGRSLGQAAGFPGDVVRGGACGFLAPLWEVHDRAARDLAENFYRCQLAGEVSVAGFIAEQRADYQDRGSTTPMAYVYYGHPKLRVRLCCEEDRSG